MPRFAPLTGYVALAGWLAGACGAGGGGSSGGGAGGASAGSGGAAGTAGGTGGAVAGAGGNAMDAGGGGAMDAGGDGDAPDTVLAAVVGAAGGMVSGSNGAIMLRIPAGALLGDTTFLVSSGPAAPTSPDYTPVPGASFRILWTGAGFVDGATIGVHVPLPVTQAAAASGEGLQASPSDAPTAGVMVCPDGSTFTYASSNSDGSGYDNEAVPVSCTPPASGTGGGGGTSHPGQGGGSGSQGGAGEISMAIVTVSDSAFPTITRQPLASLECRTDQFLTISVAATGAAPLQYQWFYNGVAGPPGDGPFKTVGTIASSVGDRYHVTVSNVYGLVTSIESTVVAADPPAPLTWETATPVASTTFAAGVGGPATGSLGGFPITVWNDGGTLRGRAGMVNPGYSFAPLDALAVPVQGRPKLVSVNTANAAYVVFIDDDGTGGCPDGTGDRLSAIALGVSQDGAAYPLSDRQTLYRSTGDCVGAFTAGLADASLDDPNLAVVFVLVETAAQQLRTGTAQATFQLTSQPSEPPAGTWAWEVTEPPLVLDPGCDGPPLLGRDGMATSMQAFAQQSNSATAAFLTWAVDGDVCAARLSVGLAVWSSGSAVFDGAPAVAPVAAIDAFGNAFVIADRVEDPNAAAPAYDLTAAYQPLSEFGDWSLHVLGTAAAPSAVSATVDYERDAFVVWRPNLAPRPTAVFAARRFADVFTLTGGTWEPTRTLSAATASDVGEPRVCPLGFGAFAVYTQATGAAGPAPLVANRWYGGLWSAPDVVASAGNEVSLLDCTAAPSEAFWREADPNDATAFRIAGAYAPDPGTIECTGAEAAARVVSVAIPHQDLVLLPGGSATLTAQASDAAGQPVGAPITWHSSNEAVVIVDGGVVVARTVGRAQVTASAGAATSAPVTVWVNPPGSSGDLIADAVAAGTISAGDALVYRVYAAFGDPRLPVQYQPTAASTGPGNDLLLVQAANQFATLTPEQQQDVGPFLVPPAYEPAATATPPGTFPAPTDDNPRPDFCSGRLSIDWAAQVTDHFKVWRNTKTATWTTASVAAVAASAEDAYATLVTGGGFRTPLDDSAFACDGGDGKLDIYLLDHPLKDAVGMTVPINETDSGETAPVYIVLSSELAVEQAGSEELRTDVVHEFMHAVQFAYPNMGLGSYEWTLDSTAVWAEMTVTPTSTSYQAFASELMDRIDEPLFFPNYYCSQLAGPECSADPSSGDKMYGSYLFFQFVTKTAGPNTVRTFFESASGFTDPLGAVNYALLGVGGLTTTWPQFVLALWNQDPVPKADSFRGWDGLADTLEPPTFVPHLVDIDLSAATITAKKLTGPTVLAVDGVKEVGLRELSAAFDHYTFDDHVHSLVVYNGFSQKLTSAPFFFNGPPNTQPQPIGNVLASFDSVTPDQAKGRHLRAFVKIGGVWAPPKDWTDEHIITFCRDKAAERIEDLVLLYSNGNFTTTRDDTFDANALGPIGDQPTTLIASPMPCWKYQGTYDSELVYPNPPATVDTMDTFDISNTLLATFVGSPHIAPVTLASGGATVLAGWRWTADLATIVFTSRQTATLKSCGPNYVINSSKAFDTTFFDNPPYYFDSAFPLPGGVGEFAYAGDGGQFYWTDNLCGGANKNMPALPIYDFSLDWTKLQKMDPATLQLTSGPAGVSGPIRYNGDYPNPGRPVDTWRFSALAE